MTTRKVLLQSFVIDLLFWMPWVPLTHLFRSEVGHSMLADFLTGALFLAPRMVRWLGLNQFSTRVENHEMKLFRLAILLQGIAAILTTASMNIYFILAMVSVRGLIQASFDITRPALLNRLESNSSSNFQVYLIPSLAMGIGSIVGWLAAGYLPLAPIFLISGVLSLCVLGFKNFETNLGLAVVPQPTFEAIVDYSRFSKLFADRFALACVFGATPLLMHLKFETFPTSGAANFALFMGAVSVGVALALVAPLVAFRVTQVNRYLFFLGAWILQIILLEATKPLAIVGLTISTVYLQFIFGGAVSRDLLSTLATNQVGRVMMVATRFEIAGAVCSHLVYAILNTLLNPSINFFIPTLLAGLVWIACFGYSSAARRNANV